MEENVSGCFFSEHSVQRISRYESLSNQYWTINNAQSIQQYQLSKYSNQSKILIRPQRFIDKKRKTTKLQLKTPKKLNINNSN